MVTTALTGVDTTENPSQVDDTMGDRKKTSPQLDDIVKILTGTCRIPSMKQAFHEAMIEYSETRWREWRDFSFITGDDYNHAMKRAEMLRKTLAGMPESYRELVSDYADQVDMLKDYAYRDGFFKGIIDGMELQRLIHGNRERGEA